MINPLPSPSQITRPTLAHFSEPIGVGLPPSTGTFTTVEYPAPAPLNMPQAICFPSGDHDGPEVEKPFGCLSNGNRSRLSAAVSVCHHQRHVFLIFADESELLAVGREPDRTENAIENFCRSAAQHRNAIERWYELVSFERRDVVDHFAVRRERRCRGKRHSPAERFAPDCWSIFAEATSSLAVWNRSQRRLRICHQARSKPGR